MDEFTINEVTDQIIDTLGSSPSDGQKEDVRSALRDVWSEAESAGSAEGYDDAIADRECTGDE